MMFSGKGLNVSGRRKRVELNGDRWKGSWEKLRKLGWLEKTKRGKRTNYIHNTVYNSEQLFQRLTEVLGVLRSLLF